jgi:hypothetical protein
MINSSQLANNVDLEEFVSSLAAFAVQTFDPVKNARRYFTDPIAAAIAAWAYEHDPQSEFVENLSDLFPEILAAMCGCDPKKLSGDAGKAFGEFKACLIVALRCWRSQQPSEGPYGSVAAHWCEQHPWILSKVQEALGSRVGHPEVQKVEWTFEELAAFGGRENVPTNDKLSLCMTVRFAGQRTWGQAAQTAAFALFGDFLLSEAESTAFCKHCEKIFWRGQKKLFCSLTCARIHSASRSRDVAMKISRRKTFRSASKALTKWLQSHRKLGSDWRMYVQNAAYGMQTRDGRHNRTLGAYIRASRTETGSPERDKLVRSLQDADIILESPKGSKAREKVQIEFDAFLRNIQRAEKIHQGSKHK